ncbi:MAG: hypothetical protein FP826_08940 [Sphingomonadales bacterium]|nr:hypothetical protein [Sphingomonadales bacterium]
MTGWNWNRKLAAVAVLALGLALSACLLTPGRFTSTLDLRQDGRFAFAYNGEIHLLALSKLAEMGNAAKKSFSAEPCYDDNMNKRACKADELAEQQREFEQERKSSAEKSAWDAEGMKALLGGIDPSNPKAAEELAARLRRQAGWNSVVYKGDGLFLVDFTIAGRLDHDFTFPTIERFPMANAFVQITRRGDGAVRIDAPGFGAGSGVGNPFQAMLSGGMMGAKGKSDMPAPPTFDGTFTLTTDGAILANNTDEGPQASPAGKKLAWIVNPRSAAAPTALVKLGN